ncbi:MAG: 2Fe-2S iron-sulfur cluster-binding protein [Opitutales bacterium]
MADKVIINVNSKEYEVPVGMNLIDACALVGIEIPHFCYHPNLSIAGSCRLCLVQTGMPALDPATREIIKEDDGSMRISWMPKPVIACATKVCQNLHVQTENDLVKSCRSGALEFFLANHPLDCPICDCAGECKLQEYCNAYGRNDNRYIEEKNVKPKLTDIAGKIYLDNERCVLCSRCIRISKEILGKQYLSFTKRGSQTCVAAIEGENIDNNYIMNIVDNCPVGALTSKDFRFKMRTYFLKATNSISTESSAGVNIKVWSRGKDIYRITPNTNSQVNDCWTSDSSRMLYKVQNSEFRLKEARIDGTTCDTSYAVKRAGEILGLGKVAIIASSRQTVEEQFLTAKLVKDCKARVYLVSHLGEDDGFLVSADRSPNMRGAFLNGLATEYPQQDLLALREKVLVGEVETVLSFGENILSYGFEEKDLKSLNLIYCDCTENSLSHIAKIALPVKTVFEKAGSYINRQWRLQKFDVAVDADESVYSPIKLISQLIKEITNENFADISLVDIRKMILDELGIDISKVDGQGLVLDSSKFADITFPEGKALHYDK